MSSLKRIYTVYDGKGFEPKQGVKRNYGIEYVYRMNRIADKLGCELVVIESKLPGWWGKIDLFQYPSVFYMDLSIAVLDDITDMITERGKFTACRDFIHNDILNSKIMSWDEDVSHVYDKFMERPEQIMSQYTAGVNMWGDQSFIDHTVGEREYFQDKYPDRIVSYRMGKITDKTSILAFHGKPKPHDTEYW